LRSSAIGRLDFSKNSLAWRKFIKSWIFRVAMFGKHEINCHLNQEVFQLLVKCQTHWKIQKNFHKYIF
jgi:hypothetical protein